MANQRQFSNSDTSVWNDRYGSGSDGATSINTSTDATANTTLTGTSATSSATAGSGSGFVSGNLILIHQSFNTGAGSWELNKISSVGAGTNWTLTYPLQNTYGTGAQVYLLKQYTTVTINGSQTLTGQTYGGSTGGIIAFLASQSITVTGTITGVGTGFRGGISRTGAQNTSFDQGEGQNGVGGQSTAANAEGGGGGSSDPGNRTGGGGGGSYGTAGTSGGTTGGATGGTNGSTNGAASLTTMFFGGGGGAGAGQLSSTSNAGAIGGGIVLLIAPTITVTGGVNGGGATGTSGASSQYASSGGGAGGSVLLKGQSITLGASLVTAQGGTGGSFSDSITGAGGNGGDGRIHIDYSNTLSGTTSPTLNSSLDSALADPRPQSVKADIKVTTSQALSVKANILKSNTTQANSAKSNLILVRGTKDNSVIANFARTYYEKKYDYRVYNGTTGAFITTWSAEVISEPNFRTIIDGGPGELVVRLKRTFDDFGEDVDVTLNNTVELWCMDRDNPSGILIYSGFISGYRPVLDGQKEYIEITLLHYVTQFSYMILRNSDGSTDVPENSKDPSTIFQDIIDKYRADAGKIFYTASSIDTTNTTVTYDFSTYMVKDAVSKTIELSPDDWYWRVDPDNTFHLHISNFAAADHIFYIGKHIRYMETFRRGEDIVNRVYLVGGGSPSLYRVYSNTGSITSYGIRATVYVDQRVTVTGTADTIANRILNQKKDPEIRTTITILDNNGIDAGKGYDIESVKVGQTMRIFGLKPASRSRSLWNVFVWDTDVWDQTISAASTDILQIQSVSYTPKSISIEASSRLPVITKRIEDIDRNLVQSQTTDTPSAPTAG